MQNPSNDVFDDFDDEHGNNLLGSLHIDTEEEPVRRGASRANSVRFADPALQGENWTHASRNSGDFGPIRPSSGFGSHPMSERQLSHKSDGRHSSAGHSVHSMQSGRNSSLGLDTNFIIGNHEDDSPLNMPAPPPGLFILGSVPSIIRCWLSTNFSHSALLYAAVCTGAQRSTLEYSLVKELGLVDQVQKDPSGRSSIRLPVYLPEAIITQPFSRSNSPAPQLPTLTADFETVGMNQRSTSNRKNAMRVFLGSDILRAHSADILLSQNLMTIYGDDRSKISVPFVRPEDETVFKNLCTTNVSPEKNELKATAPAFTPIEGQTKFERTPTPANSDFVAEVEETTKAESVDVDQKSMLSQEQLLSPGISKPISELNKAHQEIESKAPSGLIKPPPGLNGNISDSEKQPDSVAIAETPDGSVSSDPPRRESSGGIWGSWRQGTTASGSENGESTSGYQRATRGGRNMKVLKPSKSIAALVPNTSRSSSAARTGTTYEPPPARPLGETRRKSTLTGVEGPPTVPLRWDSKKEEQKAPKSIATIPRSANPVGGASAFSWMSSVSKPKASATAE
jgi:hypothetical protein